MKPWNYPSSQVRSPINSNKSQGDLYAVGWGWYVLFEILKLVY